MNPARALLGSALLTVLVMTVACSRKPSASDMQAWNAEILRLQAEQDSLRSRVQEFVANDVRIQGLPKGEVVIAVPTTFLRGVIERLFTDVASHVTLQLSGIKARVANHR